MTIVQPKMRAVVLAGGKGTRLRPYTVVLPKPLMPLGEYPILEVVVRQLARHGFRHITMAVNHQADLIKAYFNDGAKWDVLIDYSLEREPLGTMGPLRLIEDLPEHFLAMNGDVLTDLHFGELFDEHVRSNHKFTLSSHLREQVIDYGVIESDERHQLRQFSEKPRMSYEVSMGVYMLSRSILKIIPPTGPYGFDHLMKDMLATQMAVTVRRYSGYWLDIGRAEDYMQAIDEFDRMRQTLLHG